MPMPGDVDNPSLAPDALRDLSEEQTDRLTVILDDYLVRLEGGEPLGHQAILAENPDIQAALKLYLGKLGELHNFAAGFSPHLAGDLSGNEATAFETEQLGHDPAADERKKLVDDTDAVGDGSTIPPLIDGDPVDVAASDQAAVNAAPDYQPIKVPTKVLVGDIDPQDETAAGRRLGDFELVRVIGRGGMGIVYEAKQLSLRRRVALKLLPLISVLDARQIARFKNEAQAAANLQHPNIVPVHAVGSYQGVHYYAMRLIDGYPLDVIISALRQRREALATQTATQTATPTPTPDILPDEPAAKDWTLPPAYQRVVRLGIEAAGGLASAHEDGIIHRDIKPSNLLLDKKGKLWITDFGLARSMSDHSLTATGDVMGTLRYMSPEQSRGQTALIDGRSDVYSLGATLYELLALEPAMTGESSPAMLRAIEQQMPISLRHLRPDVPRDLVTVIEKAMAKNRDDRYLTAQDFADDLSRVLEGRPTLAKPPTLLERSTKWVQRNQRLARTAAAVGLGVLLLVSAGLAIVVQSRFDVIKIRFESAQRVQVQGEKLRALRDAYFDLSKELEPIAGTERLRQGIFTRLLDEFRLFVSKVRDDSQAESELAEALMSMGSVQSELGDFAGANKSLLESQELYRARVIAEPEVLQARIDLANCTDLLGQAAARNGETTVAFDTSLKATTLYRELVQSHGDSLRLQVAWARSSNRTAALFMDLGRGPEAAAMLADVRAKLEQVVASMSGDRADIDAHEALFETYNNVARLLTESGTETADQAAEYYQRAVDVQLQIAKGGRGLGSRQLAIAYNNLGRGRARSGRLPQACEAYHSAIEIGELLVKLAPQSLTLVQDLSVSLNNLGLAEQKLGETQSAQKQYRQAIELLQELAASNPNSIELAHELGGTFNNLAKSMEASDDPSAVDAIYEKALEKQQSAVARAPAMLTYRNFLDTHLSNYSLWLTKTNRHVQALEQAVQRRRLWPADNSHQLSIAKQLAETAVELAKDPKKQSVAIRYGLEAKQTLELAQEAGLSVQSVLNTEPFSSLAKLKSLTESARP